MRRTDSVEDVIRKFCARKTSGVETTVDFDKWTVDEALEAMQREERTRPTATRPDFWRTIMKSRITQLATAAAIIVAALIAIHWFGGSIEVAGKAWAELVQRVEQSHDGYYTEFLSAIEAKDAEEIADRANTLSEFWQGVGLLAEAKLNPQLQIRLDDTIHFVRAKTNDEMERSEQVFLAHADQFTAWLDKIEDAAWINETIHVCKQMEEYAEEIRDAADSSELGFSHIEHCLPSFMAYCQWFDQLPWDNPDQYITPATLLSGIERDLEIARREIEHLEIKDVDRYVKRCVQQVRNNLSELTGKIASSGIEGQRKLCKRLSRKVDALSDLMTYTAIASWDIQQTRQIKQDEALLQVLKKEFAGKGPLANYLLEQIDQSVDLCAQLEADGFEDNAP